MNTSPPSLSRRRLGALAVGLTLVAVACGTASTDDETDTSDTPTTGEAAPTEASNNISDAEPGSNDSSGGPAASTSGDLDPTIVSVTQAWPTNWDKRTVGLDEFLLGIGIDDPRDRIPPIDEPQFEPIADADWLDDREPGALVQFGDDVRFYPLSILTRHEIVNDEFGDVPVVVTYCPLCNTAITFDRRVDGQVLRFGVSGLLRNSDLVMWDDATTSLWQQITGEGVVGEFAGTQLDLIPTSIAAYGDVVENFPGAVSLSRDTGFSIDYGRNPYAAYSSSATPFLFDGEIDPRFPALSRVVGVTIDGEQKAYPFELLATEPAVNDDVGGVPIAVLWGGDTADALDTSEIADGAAIGSGIAYDRRVGNQTLTFSPTATETDEATFIDAETGSTWTLLGVAIDGPLAGEQLQTVTHRNEFWFAWSAFFPDAPVHPGTPSSE